jgi:hypothetical protein
MRFVVAFRSEYGEFEERDDKGRGTGRTVAGGVTVEGYFPDVIDPLKGVRLVKVPKADGGRFPKACSLYEVETAVIADSAGKAVTRFLRASYLEDVDLSFAADSGSSSIMDLARKAR